MRIYTRSGDDGTAGLIGGRRIGKDDLRMECIGAVDELNAAIGWAAVVVKQAEAGEALQRVQSELFVIGAQLASPSPGSRSPSPSPGAPGEGEGGGLPELTDAMVTRLEREIDANEAQLKPLKQFILPGGGEAAGRLHLVRGICRRAERAVVALSRQQHVPPVVLAYLNRLSDWLFVMARRANHQAGIEDIPWIPREA